MSNVEQMATIAKDHFYNGGISSIQVDGNVKKHIMMHIPKITIKGRMYQFCFCAIGSGLYDMYLKN